MQDFQNPNQSQNSNMLQPGQPATSTPPPVPKPKREVPTGFGFLIIFAVAVLSFGGVFAYQYFYIRGQEAKMVVAETPKSETAGWKTYKNENFEIKYPSNWDTDIKSAGQYGAYSLAYFAIDEKLAKVNYPFLLIVAENEDFRLGTRNWKNFELGQIKGQIAYSTGAGNEIVFTSNSGQNFYIRTKYNPDTNEMTKNILSTFKFITPSPVVGGDKDAHGCIGSAGYTWCEAKQKCLRTWEEKCETSNANTKEQNCLASGGNVSEVECNCPDERVPPDFSFGNCGGQSLSTCFCDPTLGIHRKIKACSCPAGKCFDGMSCVVIN